MSSGGFEVRAYNGRFPRRQKMRSEYTLTIEKALKTGKSSEFAVSNPQDLARCANLVYTIADRLGLRAEVRRMRHEDGSTSVVFRGKAKKR